MPLRVQQYKNRINVRKNIPQPTMVKMLQQQDKRKAEGKDSVFTFHGRRVPSSRLATARARPDVSRVLQAAGDTILCMLGYRAIFVLLFTIFYSAAVRCRMFDAVHS